MRTRRIRCGDHGSVPWDAEVICAAVAGGCGRVWKLRGEQLHVPPASCGKHCVCGRPLTGPKATARAICRHCYESRRLSEARTN